MHAVICAEGFALQCFSLINFFITTLTHNTYITITIPPEECDQKELRYPGVVLGVDKNTAWLCFALCIALATTIIDCCSESDRVLCHNVHNM